MESSKYDIEALIPHRKPFLFIDRLEHVDDDEIVGYKRFLETEYFFDGHFPDYPVVPGVILVECMAQCGGAGLAATGRFDSSLTFLAAIERAKFRKQVGPGDTIKIVVTNRRVSDKMIRQSGKAFADGDIAAEADWLCIRGA